MNLSVAKGPMKINFEEEARERVTLATQRFFAEDLDLDFSEFRAERVIDFFVRHLGAPVSKRIGETSGLWGLGFGLR